MIKFSHFMKETDDNPYDSDGSTYHLQLRGKSKTGWRKLKDTHFNSHIAADNYGRKYHTDRHGAKFYRVVRNEPLKEANNDNEHMIPWERPNHGWLGDLQHLPDHHDVTLYHGTTHDKAKSIMKSGITVPDKRTGFVSLTPDPNTAHGYASMGGEANFRRGGPQARHIPDEERSVLKIKVKAGWLKRNIDKHMHGNIGMAKTSLTDKSHYDKFKKEYPNAPDHLYYGMTEYRVPPIPNDNPHVQYMGIMKKPLKNKK